MLFLKEKNFEKIIFPLLWLLSVVFYLFFLTDGDLLLISAKGKDFFDEIFNDMFFRLKKGDFTIARELIRYEAFVKDGNTYSYFGVFPVLIRAVLSGFVDLSMVSISRLSCFLGLSSSSLVLISLSKLLLKKAKDNYQKAICYLYCLCLIFTGPILYMSANASIYHEVIVYSMLFSSSFVYILLKRTIIENKCLSKKDYFFLATLAGLTLHNRVIVAISLYLIILVKLFYSTKRKKTYLSQKNIFTLLILFIFGVLALYINYQRWGNIFVFADYSGYKSIQDSAIRKVFFESSSLFNIKRLFVSLSYYLTGNQSFILFLDNKTKVFFDGMETPFASMILNQSFLLFFVIMGVFFVMKKKAQRGLRFVYVSFFPTIFFSLSFMYLTLRYRGDFLFLVVFSSFLGILYFFEKLKNYGNMLKNISFSLLCFISISSLYFSFQTFISYRYGPLNSVHREVIPKGLEFLKWLL